MKTLTITDNDTVELLLLRDRLARERSQSHKRENSSTLRTNDLDNELEVLNRLLRQVGR